MISALIFSRDRPAQLDLLLRSLALNAPWLDDATVIYKPTARVMEEGYRHCERHHDQVKFVREETDFRGQVITEMRHHQYTMLLCDDDVMFRPLNPGAWYPDAILAVNPEYLCVSLRLGINTTRCYSLNKQQTVQERHSYGVEEGGHLSWPWGHDATGDYAYPASLDGHIYRTHQLKTLMVPGSWRHEALWKNPNELEDHLTRAAQTCLLPMMASYPQSCVVGVPVNRVTETHTNRTAETHVAPVATLARGYVEGQRLSLASIDPALVDAAHVEFRLLWEHQVAVA